jgi:hypothetical protein
MNRIVALLLTLALFVSAGCQRKVLLEPHDHSNLTIKAHFDSLALSQLLSQKTRYTNPGEPKTTKYILYDKNSPRRYTGEINGLNGGVYAAEGVYDTLLYTTDFNEVDANFFRNLNNYDIAETYTRQTLTDETRGDVAEMYIVEPDPTFSALLKDIVVLRGHEDNIVEVELVQKSFKYYLTIKAIGLHNIHSAKMHISGMYTTAFLTNEEHRLEEVGTQSLDLEIIRYTAKESMEIGEGELYGEFWSFGPNIREDVVNSITLYLINGDTRVILLDDLTSQIKRLTKGGEIVVEQELEIKGPPGGFQPGVGNWNDPTDVEMIL